ncbi:MAG: MvaI/BcnI family restriction endonuclease [Gemmatimonadales bacterium]
MRDLQDIERGRLAELTSAGFRFSLLQPTGNALEKSIIDAIQPFREFLAARGVHDFSVQQQGAKHKVVMPASVLVGEKWEPANATLYRPTTKQGDPRIWFSRLPRYVGANNILAVIERDARLFVVNLSRTDVAAALKSGPLSAMVDDGLSVLARELLDRLRTLAGMGPLRALGAGDTAVGMTLEAALGLPPNSRPTPDFKGIELKAARGAHKTRSNLFAQVADWDLSGCRSSAEILDLFGYFRGDVEKLYCTVSARRFNAQGLRLEVLDGEDRLQETSQVRSNVAVWRLAKLRARLLEKHPETFWVSVKAEHQDGVEFYTLLQAGYTRDPNPSQLGPLIASGVITMDHLIKRKTSGGVVEKGPLFKMNKKDFGSLFPPIKEFTL